MKSVMLRTAFEWTCDHCGIDNFSRSITLDEAILSEEDRNYIRDDCGVTSYEEGEFVLMPETVICGHCKSEFKVE